MNSLDSELFMGQSAADDQLQEEWKRMVRTWGGAVIVGSIGRIYVFCKSNRILNVKIPLPDSVGTMTYEVIIPIECIQKGPESQVTAVGWALRPKDIVEPLAIVAASRSIFIINLTSLETIGKIRGHGAVKY